MSVKCPRQTSWFKHSKDKSYFSKTRIKVHDISKTFGVFRLTYIYLTNIYELIIEWLDSAEITQLLKFKSLLYYYYYI